MFAAFKSLFEVVNEAPPTESQIQSAAALLLIEVAKADQSIEQGELQRIQEVLSEQWSLSSVELDQLINEATETAKWNASLHEHVELVNAHFSQAQKYQLVLGLWRVACADQVIHHHEEHLVRRVADLLHVSHKDFIRSKHEALEN
ncbi:MAG: TerB family tellurite resistance protein [Sedimenticolaceae bacterium]